MEPLKPFSIDVEREGSIIYARLAGEMDMAVAARFNAEMADLIAQAQGATLMVDLRGLSFMDSTGIRLMLQLEAESRRDGFDLAIINGNGIVQRVLRESGVDRILPMRETL